MSRTEAIPTHTLTHTLKLIAEEQLAYDPYDAVVSLPGIVGTDGLFDYRESVLSLVPQDGYINLGTMWSRNKTAARYALPTKMLQSKRAPKKTAEEWFDFIERLLGTLAREKRYTHINIKATKSEHAFLTANGYTLCTEKDSWDRRYTKATNALPNPYELPDVDATPETEGAR